ncbi:Hypothetical_protein [Hexamita inflata]|uniref:Hypothetical_protein n=1 Tax=Hexamita inflata TaxID=28002 RepID=A0AA86P6M4_9EUKA|nr:Hypothetical protein HINF_LOCUS20165 [Hexamita inflata]
MVAFDALLMFINLIRFQTSSFICFCNIQILSLSFMFQVFNCRRLLRPIQRCHLRDLALAVPFFRQTISLTLLRRDGAFMQIISDQAGVMQLGFFVNARLCKTAVFAQEEVHDL